MRIAVRHFHDILEGALSVSSWRLAYGYKAAGLPEFKDALASNLNQTIRNSFRNRGWGGFKRVVDA